MTWWSLALRLWQSVRKNRTSNIVAAAFLYRPGSNVKQMLADTPDRVSSDDGGGVRAAVLNDDHVKPSGGKSTGETLQHNKYSVWVSVTVVSITGWSIRVSPLIKHAILF